MKTSPPIYAQQRKKGTATVPAQDTTGTTRTTPMHSGRIWSQSTIDKAGDDPTRIHTLRKYVGQTKTVELTTVRAKH